MFAWLKSISKNAAKDHFRKHGPRAEAEELRAEVDVVVETGTHREELARQVERVAIEQAAKSPTQAKAYAMLKERADGVPVDDIAADRGIPVDTARKDMRRFSVAVEARLYKLATAAAAVDAILLYLYGPRLLDRPTTHVAAGFPTVRAPRGALPDLPAAVAADAPRPRSLRVRARAPAPVPRVHRPRAPPRPRRRPGPEDRGGSSSGGGRPASIGAHRPADRQRSEPRSA